MPAGHRAQAPSVADIISRTMDAKKSFEQAMEHQRAGRIAEAEQALEKILRFQPAHPDAVKAMAILLVNTRRPTDAATMLRRAIDTEPHNATFYEHLADLLRGSDPAEAEKACRQALQMKPMSAPTHALLGDILLDQNRIDDAIEAFQFAIRARPGHSFPRIRLAEAQRRAGRLQEVERTLRDAVVACPRDLEAYHTLAMFLAAQGNLEEAESILRDVTRRRPDHLPTHASLVDVMLRGGRLAEAEQACRDAIRGNPKAALLHAQLGHVLVPLGRLAEAEAAYRHALELDQRLLPAIISLSSVLSLEGKVTEALGYAQHAVQAAPGSADAYGALGNALWSLGHADESLRAFAQAWQLASSPSAGSNLLHAMNYALSVEPAQVLAAHRAWAQRHADHVAPARTHTNDRDPQRRLRIGYVSPDVRAHAVSYFIEPLLEAHDRARVEVFCYASVGVPDAVTERLRNRADQWRDIARLSDEAAAEMIAGDAIDILIDLAGHTNLNRLGVLAHRPAPVQVTYQGYPNTTGMSAIGYRLTDPIADPPGMTDQYHTEQLVRLPRTAWCYRPPEPAPPVAELPARRCGAVTFGSFNRLSKVNPYTAELWARAVNAVPGARLMFKTAGLDDAATAGYVRELFKRAGLDPERLILVGSEPSFQKHLERYGEIDLALDTYPYHGTTTTCEALWMGVPSVTLYGPVHVSRVSLSLLTNVGLADFAADSGDAFVETAARAAGDLDRLAELRRTIRQRMAESPLMDARGFAREVEAAYREMWHKWCATT
jgi:predicted O-linked N-acetylglucosamine transferase (SPINDLY family)